MHWVLAGCVIVNLFVIEDGDPHRYLGYIGAAVVLSRFFWAVRKKELSAQNPIALLVYFGIWSLVLALGVTGWMMGLDKYWGETWLEELHETLGDSILILVGVHLAGIFIDSAMNRRKTWMRMISRSD